MKRPFKKKGSLNWKDYQKIMSQKNPYGNSSLPPYNLYGTPIMQSGSTATTGENFVLFYGFNGPLASKYSIVRNYTVPEVQARMATCGKDVPWKLLGLGQFTNLMNSNVAILSEIQFEDAMLTIRASDDKPKVVDEFEDAEVDEFDDNCIETCIPGQHACGK